MWCGNARLYGAQLRAHAEDGDEGPCEWMVEKTSPHLLQFNDRREVKLLIGMKQQAGGTGEEYVSY